MAKTPSIESEAKLPSCILSLDIGTNRTTPTMGMSIWMSGEFIVNTYQFAGLVAFKKYLSELITLYKPDLIIIPYPTRFYNTLIAHAKVMGIIEYLAEYHDITVIETQDAHCKNVVLGAGKKTKEEIAEFFKKDYPDASEHSLDALMFIKAYLKDIL